MSNALDWIFRRDRYLPPVAGLCDGILSALTPAAGRMLDAARPMTMGTAFRVAAGALASGAFIFFVGHYAQLRGELVHAERELNLTAHGRFARTRLGAAVLRDALAATVIGSGCSFLGALLPLAISALFPGQAWLGIAAAIGILGLLGLGLARTLYGSSIRWALCLVVSGILLSYLGVRLRIV
jgi:VIT1/CCC1 family predicted Fe2+/Mn2+ transporter